MHGNFPIMNAEKNDHRLYINLKYYDNGVLFDSNLDISNNRSMIFSVQANVLGP